MSPPIETASELYREIKRRGLHLRKNNGRDNALLQELAAEINCPNTYLQRFLNSSDISAEEFFHIFIKTAQPFARMFCEIWDYLGINYAPKAQETISIRFGFPDSTDPSIIDLEQFRCYAETVSETILNIEIIIWPEEALHKLFDISRILYDNDILSYDDIHDHYERYHPGYKYKLPKTKAVFHPFDSVINNINKLFQSIINEYHLEYVKEENTRNLPELQAKLVSSRYDNKSLQHAAYLLTDLLPTWYQIFRLSDKISPLQKEKAWDYYKKEIEPIFKKSQIEKIGYVREALDILDLPFWRHRWHTYEIWSTILTLRTLDKYRPVLKIKNGYLPIDGYSSQIIADLKVKDFPDACVAIQVQTPFKLFGRKAIKPDLRICSSNCFIPENTAVVVEFKQRLKLTSNSLQKTAQIYHEGSPNSKGVIILNYDESPASPLLPKYCSFIPSVNPCNKQGIDTYEDALLNILEHANYSPDIENTFVLLDVSGSMGDSYIEPKVQLVLRKLIGMKWLKILRFNNGLTSGGDLHERDYSYIKTSGGTELGRALTEVIDTFGLPEKMLIVTDGGHDHPQEIMQKITFIKECRPRDIEENLKWLM